MHVETIISLLALGISLIMLLMTARRDTRSDVRPLIETQVKLDAISSGINDLRVEIGRQRDQLSTINKELVRLAEAHNALERRVARLERHEEGED